jgi:RNA polymerase sigma-70 factor, ECF subfamily
MDVDVIDLLDDTPEFASEAGFRRIWTAHVAEMRAFAVRRITDSGRAEDAVQETFLRAWRSAGRFDPARGSARAWLYTILRNELIDQARANASRPKTVKAEVEVIAADEHERRVLALVVAEALQRLSPTHREAIVESYYRQRTTAEVADRVGVPIGTVRSRLFYGLKALGNALDDMGLEADDANPAS